VIPVSDAATSVTVLTGSVACVAGACDNSRRNPLAVAGELGNTVVVKTRPAPTAGERRVARCLLAGGPSTASALASALHLTPTAVRKHLDGLVAAGWVQATQSAPYGPMPSGSVRGRGRPARVFSLTALGREGFDEGYDDLARQALRHLAQRDGRAAVREFAAERAAALAGEVAQRCAAHPEDHSTPAARAVVLAEVLVEEGFSASVTPAPVGVQVCQHNCPVAHAAAEFPELCEAEAAAFALALGTHVTRLSTISGGDAVCTTLVPDTPNPGRTLT